MLDFTPFVKVQGAQEPTTTNMFIVFLIASRQVESPAAGPNMMQASLAHIAPHLESGRSHRCEQGLGHLCQHLTALIKLRIDYRCRYSPGMGKPALSFAANIHRLTALTCLKVGFTLLDKATQAHPS